MTHIPAERKGFLFDPNKCTGCQACEIACTIENELGDTSWREVVTLNEERRPGVPVIHLSMACNHCADAPCAKACPALAYTQDPVTGRVDLNPDHCIGCKYCSWACPYDAPKFDAPRGVMTKCTFCGHRQDQGLEPACVEMCPTGALGFGELETLPGTPQAAGMPTAVPDPSIRFMPWAGKGATACGAAEETALPASKISLRAEWPLLGFTLIAAAVVAAFTASTWDGWELHPVAFLAAAAGSMGLSFFHLGRKSRAWRAILNVRRSWLSREIALYSAFVGLAVLHLLILSDQGWIARVAAVVGFLALFAMDRVYDVVRPEGSPRLHSADVLLTGGLLTAILLGALQLTVTLAVLKVVLYLLRKLRSQAKAPRPWWSLARLACGFVLPGALGLVDPERWPMWALVGTALGELVDRGELYAEAEVPTPRRQMALETRLPAPSQ